jgi:hypothetical protein
MIEHGRTAVFFAAGRDKDISPFNVQCYRCHEYDGVARTVCGVQYRARGKSHGIYFVL